jgi:hypothetical protein
MILARTVYVPLSLKVQAWLAAVPEPAYVAPARDPPEQSKA